MLVLLNMWPLLLYRQTCSGNCLACDQTHSVGQWKIKRRADRFGFRKDSRLNEGACNMPEAPPLSCSRKETLLFNGIQAETNSKVNLRGATDCPQELISAALHNQTHSFTTAFSYAGQGLRRSAPVHEAPLVCHSASGKHAQALCTCRTGKRWNRILMPPEQLWSDELCMNVEEMS